ncbi:hypothetical protein R6Q57_023923 [Mikania cordata]
MEEQLPETLFVDFEDFYVGLEHKAYYSSIVGISKIMNCNYKKLVRGSWSLSSKGTPSLSRYVFKIEFNGSFVDGGSDIYGVFDLGFQTTILILIFYLLLITKETLPQWYFRILPKGRSWVQIPPAAKKGSEGGYGVFPVRFPLVVAHWRFM